jgi:hypothetical protein
VKQALDLEIPLALAHEQDERKGGCAFSLFFEQTPKDLQDAPYKLFDTLAVPLFSAQPELCKISLRHLLRQMGGIELKARMDQNHGNHNNKAQAVALPNVFLLKETRQADDFPTTADPSTKNNDAQLTEDHSLTFECLEMPNFPRITSAQAPAELFGISEASAQQNQSAEDCNVARNHQKQSGLEESEAKQIAGVFPPQDRPSVAEKTGFLFQI